MTLAASPYHPAYTRSHHDTHPGPTAEPTLRQEHDEHDEEGDEHAEHLDHEPAVGGDRLEVLEDLRVGSLHIY